MKKKQTLAMLLAAAMVLSMPVGGVRGGAGCGGKCFQFGGVVCGGYNGTDN